MAKWTRVKDVYTVTRSDYDVYDIYQDTINSQAKATIRSFLPMRRGVYIFDPEEYKRRDPSLRMELHKLSV